MPDTYIPHQAMGTAILDFFSLDFITIHRIEALKYGFYQKENISCGFTVNLKIVVEDKHIFLFEMKKYTI